MILTGKCKEDFKKWFLKNDEINQDYYIESGNKFSEYQCISFYDLPQSMQYGVYVDFFDSVGLIIQMDIGNLRFSDDDKIFYQSGVGGYRFNETTETRHEARVKAIEKANEIYNSK